MNTIGPMNNWQETYDYYQLPFCHGDSPVQHHHETLGEALQGMDLINSGIPMSYLSKLNFLWTLQRLWFSLTISLRCSAPAKNEPICKATLHTRDMDLFRYAIANNYWYQMFIGTSGTATICSLMGLF